LCEGWTSVHLGAEGDGLHLVRLRKDTPSSSLDAGDIGLLLMYPPERFFTGGRKYVCKLYHLLIQRSVAKLCFTCGVFLTLKGND
jgi:hypothetical protein